MSNSKRAIIVFSGGQDSTTVLGAALKANYECFAVGFDYGQRHAVELECANKIANKHGVPYQIVDIRAFGKMVTSAMTGNGEVQKFGMPHARMKDVPSSFVPNRNALMLTIAYALAQELDCDSIWTGVCETDYSGYPDCRHEFITHLQATLNIGYKTNIDIVTPSMWLNKAETFRLAAESGILNDVLELSHTCYEGDHSTHHDWGFGCGECPSCKLRAAGWEQYIASLPEGANIHGLGPDIGSSDPV